VTADEKARARFDRAADQRDQWARACAERLARGDHTGALGAADEYRLIVQQMAAEPPATFPRVRHITDPDSLETGMA
jgi:hypothetical protein